MNGRIRVTPVRASASVLSLVILTATACSSPAGTPAARTPSIESVAPPAVTATPGSGGPRFPAAVSENDRYFVDQEGEAWFGLGDTAWSLIGQLGPADMDLYLDDRSARGFNLVLANVLEHRYSDNAPNNHDDHPPFTEAAFRSPPNEAYWRNVDHAVEAARVRGVTLLLCPAYLGYNTDEGWSEEMAEATDEDMSQYGAFLRDRYEGFPNIMWLLGHDRVPDDTEKSRMEALAAELPPDDLVGLGASRDEDPLGIRPWSPTTISADFETVYNFGETTVDDTQEAWAARPTRPVMYLEGRYEQEGSAGMGASLLRLQAYGAVAAGASAVLFGNNPIWHFESVALYDYEGSWEDNLDSLGSTDAQRAGGLVRGLPWWEMAPDVAGDLLVGDETEGAERSAARYSGSHALIYLPTSRRLTLDLSALDATEQVEVRRVDPRSGAEDVVGTFSTRSRASLPVADENASRDEDWIYLVAPAT
jgi:hypothetical protein